MSKGKQNKSTNRQVDPALQGFVERNIGRADALMDGVPKTPEAYGGDWVADLQGRTESGLDAMYERGMGGSREQQGFDRYLRGQLGQNLDPSDIQRRASAFGMQGARGARALGYLGERSMGLDEASQFAQGQQTPYDAALQQQASGAVNPLTSQMFQQAAGDLSEQFQENIMPGINAQFASSGRVGSGAQSRALTDAAGELADAQAGLAANMFGGAAESALGRQLQAGQAGLSDQLSRRQLGANLYQGDRGLRQQAAQGAAQAGLGGLGQMSNIYGTQAQQQMGAAGLAPQAQAMDYRDIGAMTQAGDRLQQQQQAEIDAVRQRYDQDSMRGIQDWTRRVGALSGLSGVGNPLAAGTDESSRGKGKKVGS
jgi:hypothetical protein